MDLIKASNLTPSPLPFFTTTTKFSSHFCTFLYNVPRKPLALRAKKRTSDSEPLLEPSLLQEVSFDDEEEDDELLDEFEFEAELDDDDDDVIVDDGDEVDVGAGEDEEEEEYEDGDAVVYVGDGGAGGGISLAGTWWDKKALAIAKEVTASFDGDLQIYAFKTLVNSTILVRIERLTNKSGSPTMEDIEAFSTTYRTKLDEAEIAKFVPENLSLEVSSPGVERIVRIPTDLDRFKDRPMYVNYSIVNDSDNSSAEGDGVFRLESFDMETKFCTWGIADVRVNRGKGRPLNKKQREWRLSTPFDSLRLVRLHSDI